MLDRFGDALPPERPVRWDCADGWTGVSPCPGCGRPGPLPPHVRRDPVLEQEC